MTRAQKNEWRICALCGERFEASTIKELDKLLELHKVYGDQGQQCMGAAQMERTFKQEGRTWRMK